MALLAVIIGVFALCAVIVNRLRTNRNAMIALAIASTIVSIISFWYFVAFVYISMAAESPPGPEYTPLVAIIAGLFFVGFVIAIRFCVVMLKRLR